MNGHRAKALKRAFVLKFGRQPDRGQAIRKTTGAIEPFQPTQIQKRTERWNKRAAWIIARALSTNTKELVKAKYELFAERFLRNLFTMQVTETSEWRRWKKSSFQLSAISSQRKPLGVLSVMSESAKEENNRRCWDTRERDKDGMLPNQATGKRRRAGVYATKVRF